MYPWIKPQTKKNPTAYNVAQLVSKAWVVGGCWVISFLFCLNLNTGIHLMVLYIITALWKYTKVSILTAMSAHSAGKGSCLEAKKNKVLCWVKWSNKVEWILAQTSLSFQENNITDSFVEAPFPWKCWSLCSELHPSLISWHTHKHISLSTSWPWQFPIQVANSITSEGQA